MFISKSHLIQSLTEYSLPLVVLMKSWFKIKICTSLWLNISWVKMSFFNIHFFLSFTPLLSVLFLTKLGNEKRGKGRNEILERREKKEKRTMKDLIGQVIEFCYVCYEIYFWWSLTLRSVYVIIPFMTIFKSCAQLLQ